MADLLSRLACAGAALCLACSSALPAPRPARQPRSEYRPVPYPPPAAFPEVVPPRPPNADSVWIDGYWAWRGGTFVWQRGGWVVPPSGAYFARWHVRYSQDGTLQLAEAVWYGPNLKPIPDPKVVVPAYTPPNELTPESQHGF